MADTSTSAPEASRNADANAFMPLSIDEMLALAEAVRRRGGLDAVAEALFSLAMRRAAPERQSEIDDGDVIPTRPMPL
jgi:hypothetical protein